MHLTNRQRTTQFDDASSSLTEARVIIELAKTGECDVNRLRDDAIAFVTGALQRKHA
jgi:hypothetical protein